MLIEVLVSVLLFSVGVLALVGLQANMSKTQGATKIRTDASYLASEVVGIMWSDNVLNLDNYSTAACAGYARCSAWAAKVAKALPGGQATITVAANGSGKDITINITWSVPGGDTHQYSTITNINS